MSGAKIKNFIILVLLLAIAALLILVIPQQLAIRRQSRQTGELLEQLCQEDGISLDPDILPETQTIYELELTPSAAAEQAIATLLLGDGAAASETETGVYVSETGSCTFSSTDGSFSARFSPGREADDDLTDYSRTLLKSLGFDPAEISLAAFSGRTRQVTATQRYRGMPVFSSGLTLTFTDGLLTAMDGVFYVGDDQPVRISESACITCADAIVAFLSAREELGWIGEEITGITQGYIRSGVALNLTPVWRIETDTGVVQVGGIDRTVSLAAE